MIPKPLPHALLPLLLILGIATAPLAATEELESLRRENAQLRQRLDSVETDLAAIKKLLAAAALPAPAAPPGASVATSAGTPAVPAPSAAGAPAPFSPAESEKLRSLASLKGKPVRSSLDLNLYGYIKLDVAYDDSRFSLGNFARWAETESVLRDDSHFHVTANQTRLGLDVAGPVAEDFLTAAKMEIDFYGAGTGENKPEPMLRHAYVRIDWPRHKLSLTAGQTWDIISPLNPSMVNYSVAWWQGNIGYRRPQLRLTRNVILADQVEVKLDAGVTRTITGRKAYFIGANDPDTGADAGAPSFAARAALSFPLAPRQVATLGVSGHHGVEDTHLPGLIGHDSNETWSLNADLRLPLTPSLLLQAEAFAGRNLDSFLGGVGQGFNTTLNREIDVVGGWASLTANPSTRWQFNLGAGIDDPDDEDLSGSTDPNRDARTKNSLLFGNALYSPNSQIQLGFETAWLRTNYKLLAPGEGWRQHFSVTYKF
jgi:hypothetical protein